MIHSLNDLEKNNINFIEQDHKNSTCAKMHLTQIENKNQKLKSTGNKMLKR